MKVTVCFDNVRVVVPCGDGTLLVKELQHEAILRYRKATGKSDAGPTITSLSSLTGGGLLDPDDRLCDVADDREQIVAHFGNQDVNHAGGDGASSVGTNSPDFFHTDSATKEHRYGRSEIHGRISGGNIKRDGIKRLSMHALSSREPHLAAYSALSLPRESRRREPLGQDAKAPYELANTNEISENSRDIREIVIKNEAGPLGLHVVPCYDLLGNDQGLRVEGIEPNGRIAKDGQIDLHDKIIKINGHNLLRIPFSKVQDIFRSCMSDPCLRISVLKHKKARESLNSNRNSVEPDESAKKLQQGGNYNLQNANTRKIGRMIEIELTKGVNGLGFSVTTRDNPAGGHCPIYIKNILPKGAAVEDGRLRPGDRLLEVNKTEMTGKSQAEVVSILRNIPPGGKVCMTVSRQEEVSATSEQTVRETSPDTWTQKSPEKSPVYKTDDIILSPRKNRMLLTLDIPVHDSEKAGLGVSVKGKTTSADENTNMDLGIFIKSVLHGGAASRDGRLRTNDQLLNVNGVSLLGLSNSDAMETLRRAMLNTNSSVTGFITLTIARRVSSYDSEREKNFVDCKIESANSIYISDQGTKSGNLDNGNMLSPGTSSPWNPVIDRLTEQYNKNSLRNESYCLATNKTWLESVSNVKKLMLGNRDDNNDNVLLEESAGTDEGKKSNDDKESISGDPTYDSQLSLEEFNSPANKFSRDALGRQSMSEKRHAALDAKNTDTYKRNKKLREGREKGDSGNLSPEDAGDQAGKAEATSFEINGRKRSEKSVVSTDPAQSEYVYTIPGCNNKFLSPRKHWLVDDDHTEVSTSTGSRKEEGFSNSRGDVKQASLNSALDERYKRSRKKGGIRSMLRLGKNRKSLNFGDNIENRHESSNYCSGTINYIA